MAGSNPTFDAAGFRSALRDVMTLGLPNDPADQPTFHFPTTVSYPPGTAVDEDGVALDPSVPKSKTTLDPVKVRCAVEYFDATPDELPVGTFRPTKLVLTMFEDEFALVKDAEEVVIGQDRYYLSHRPPPVGLYDVTVFQIVAYAIDEK